MSKTKPVCISCNKSIVNDEGATRFKCPKCAKMEIIRCKHCRETVAKYKCANCNFEGPN